MQTDSVFDIVRRGCDGLESCSPQDIQAYFDDLSLDALSPSVVDIARWSDSDINREAQLKATDTLGHMNTSLETYPDISLVSASAITSALESASFVDSSVNLKNLTKFVDATLDGVETLSLGDSADIITEISGEVVSEVVSEGILEAVADVALPVSPLGILGFLFGLPF